MIIESTFRQHQPKSLLGDIYVWYLRVMAMVCLVSGLVYWAQLIGLSQNGALRFDVIETHWRILSTVLAVVLPSAALGLWTTQTWGVVLWVAALLIEILAFGLWSEMFLDKPYLVLSHMACLVLLAVLLILKFVQNRRLRALGI